MNYDYSTARPAVLEGGDVVILDPLSCALAGDRDV